MTGFCFWELVPVKIRLPDQTASFQNCFENLLLGWYLSLLFQKQEDCDLDFSEKPRRRLGCPSRSTFSQAPQELFLVDFGRKEYGYRTSRKVFFLYAIIQEPTLRVLLVLLEVFTI